MSPSCRWSWKASSTGQASAQLQRPGSCSLSFCARPRVAFWNLPVGRASNWRSRIVSNWSTGETGIKKELKKRLTRVTDVRIDGWHSRLSWIGSRRKFCRICRRSWNHLMASQDSLERFYDNRHKYDIPSKWAKAYFVVTVLEEWFGSGMDGFSDLWNWSTGQQGWNTVMITYSGLALLALYWSGLLETLKAACEEKAYDQVWRKSGMRKELRIHDWPLLIGSIDILARMLLWYDNKVA
jgi:hypothetical protein